MTAMSSVTSTTQELTSDLSSELASGLTSLDAARDYAAPRHTTASGGPTYLASYLSAHARNSGYLVTNETTYRFWNVAFALGMLLLALPLITATTIGLLLTQGSPFYRGVRIGKDRREFQLYKFRTLVSAAAAATADRVLPSDGSLTTPLGNFLRDTRIDELPQLLNVIRGDMNMFGPRPVRPAIASICAAQIPNYDDRFQVRPGVFGHPQIFMSHGTPKRIRSAYHRLLMKRPTNVGGEVAVILITVGSLLSKAWSKVSLRVRRLVRGRRRTPAVQPGLRGASIVFDSKAGERYQVPIKRISDQAIRFELPVALNDADLTARLSCRVRGGAKWRHARVSGALQRVPSRNPGEGTFLYLLKFEPQSEYSRHVILSYLLRRVVA
jgi:lipopolysaccharide/colanic/teichoic acid biosynthesis glycosyltransferase